MRKKNLSILCLVFVLTACLPVNTEIAYQNTDTPIPATKTAAFSSPTPIAHEATDIPLPLATPLSTPTPQIQHTAVFTESPEIENGVWQTYTNANYIKALLVDQEGYIWATGRGGVVKWDAQTGEYVKYTAVDGLAGNFVTSIAQTKDGTLWFGTSTTGLSSFDGKTWETLTTEDELPSNTITNLAAAPDGGLWIYADYVDETQRGGMVYYDDGKFIPTNARHTFDIIAVAPDGILWAGAYQTGLSRYDGVEWQYMPLIESSGVDITAIAIAPNGEVWVATWEAVLKFDGVSWQNVTPWQGSRLGLVKSIAITPEGVVWVGIAMGIRGPIYVEPEESLRHGEPFTGLYRYEDGKWASFTSRDGMADNEVTSIAIGADGSVWCGSYRYGLSRYVDKTWQVFQTRDELLGNDINDMDVTGGGENIQIILAHMNQGVSYYNSQEWHSFSEYGDISGGATAVDVESDGTLWIAGYRSAGEGGLAHFDGKRWVTYLGDIRDVYSRFNAIYFISDKLADSFFVENDRGVIEFTQDKWQTLFLLDGKWIREVRLADDGTLFFATQEGVYAKSNDQWKHFTSQNGLPGNDIMGLGVSADGSVWASSCEGLAQLNGEEWITKIYSDEQTGCFRWLVIDQKGAVWVASPRGLIYYHDGVSDLVPYPGLSGSTQLITYDVEIDEAGVIWIATDSGLFRYQP